MKKRHFFYIIVGISLLLLILNVIFYFKTKGISSSFMSFITLIVFIEIVSLWFKKIHCIYERNVSVLSVILFVLFLTISALYMPRHSYNSAKINLEKMNWTVLENDVDTIVVKPQINSFVTQSYFFKVKQGEAIKLYIFNPVTGEKNEVIE